MTKQSTAGHTELPWSMGKTGRSIIREVPGLADGYDHFMIAVASAHSLVSVEESKANAHLIVTAVNTYPAINELVEALEACQASLALMIEPKAIKSSTVMGAFTQAFEADCKARSALTHYRELAGTSNG